MNSRLLEHDRVACEEGFTAGESGTAAALRCPCPAGTTAAWSWHSGYIEGDAKRQGYSYSRTVKDAIIGICLSRRDEACP